MCTADGGHIPNTRPCLVGTPAKSAGKGVRFPLWSVDAGRVSNGKPASPGRGGQRPANNASGWRRLARDRCEAGETAKRLARPTSNQRINVSRRDNGPEARVWLR